MLNIEKINSFENKLNEIEKLLTNPDIISNPELFKNYLREHSFLLPIVKKYKEYKHISKEISKLEDLLKKNPQDIELKTLIEEELTRLYKNKEDIFNELTVLDSPETKDINKNSIIIEIRAGTGGEEAALFASDLFKMYSKYIEKKGWKLEILNIHSTELKGFKEIIFNVEGENSYDILKYESGVHRVQRIPKTETYGRIHTSTATVAVLPQVEDVILEIKPQDLRIDTFRASGHGGQHLQKTDSAVRITHIPTGITAQCQDERSQLKNREKAMKLLKARIYDKIIQEKSKDISDLRKKQIGSGDRSEKIRTYNFPQNRITDHRVNVSFYDLENIMDGDMDKLIQTVIQKIKKT